MAAALLTVGLLERGVDQEMNRPQLEEVRQQVKACIVDLRHIAGSLRPPALDEMGLANALERFAETEEERGMRCIDFSFGLAAATTARRGGDRNLPRDRGDAAGFAGRGIGLGDAGANQEQVQVMIEARAELAAHAVMGAAAGPAEVHADLVATRARVELIGGSLHMRCMSGGGRRILVQIPIAPSSD